MMNSPATHPLSRLLSRKRLRVLGINTGTSMDGLDMALVEITEKRPRPQVRVIATKSLRFPARLQDTLRRQASCTDVKKEEASRANQTLGRFIASSVERFRKGHPQARIDLIGSHGQTVGHWSASAKSSHMTWQIGALSEIALRTKVIAIGDFRSADIAAGGMGAPLSGYYHHLLFGTDFVVLNIGGIANMSASRIRRRILEIRAFDTGPGNMMADALAQRLLGRGFDPKGRNAARGQANESIIRRALADPYFRRRPPKTCGREEFGEATVERLFWQRRVRALDEPDLLMTAVEITARSIASSLQRWIVRFTTARRLIVSGGGVANATLMARVRALLPEWEFILPTAWGIPATMLEPVGFAVLAHETLRDRPGNLGGATGGRPAVLGLIALPGPQ